MLKIFTAVNKNETDQDNIGVSMLWFLQKKKKKKKKKKSTIKKEETENIHISNAIYLQ